MTSTTGADDTLDGIRTVLLVEGRGPTPAECRRWLGDGYEVRTATDARAAVERADREVDVVVLDGAADPGAVRARLRERGLTPRLAAVAGEDGAGAAPGNAWDDADPEAPDATLTAPVGRAAFVEAVERLCRVAEQDALVRDLFAVVRKKTSLEQRHDGRRLRACEEYGTLTDRYQELSARADAAVQGLDDEAFEALFRSVGGPASGAA